MTTRYHVCLDVRGALTNWRLRDFTGMFKDGDRLLTATQAKAFLLEELSKGREVIPYGECDNFSYKTGCQGHPEPAPPAALPPVAAQQNEVIGTDISDSPDLEKGKGGAK